MDGGWPDCVSKGVRQLRWCAFHLCAINCHHQLIILKNVEEVSVKRKKFSLAASAKARVNTLLRLVQHTKGAPRSQTRMKVSHLEHGYCKGRGWELIII